MAQYVNNPMCGLHGCNVVISDYNKDGKCQCLKCQPYTMHCQQCEEYKRLLKEADINQWLRLERCISCMKQK